MVKIWLVALLFTFHYCKAQKLEVKYYPSFHLNSRCIITCNDDSCVLRLDIIEELDFSKILWSEIKTISSKHLSEVKDIYAKAYFLNSSDPCCLDGIHIVGTFESNTMYNEFDFYSPNKGTQQYVFFNQSIKIMLEVLKNRKSKGYVRAIRQYL